MPQGLRLALTVTDWAFVVYWMIAVLDMLGIVTIPQAWLYADARDARVVAWNWSFLPLDLAFAATGLAAVRLAERQHHGWRVYAVISLVLTMVAGGMAVAYWALLREFDWVWFGANLLLLAWPMAYLPRLIGELSRAQ